MPDFDPSAPPSYNSMQQQMGLLPPMAAPPVIFPGQVTAAMMQGGSGAAFMAMSSGAGGAGGFGGFQTPMPTGGNQYPLNPYAGLAARGPAYGPPGLFSPNAPAPPPVYAGQMSSMMGMPPAPSPMFNTGYMAGLERAQLSSDNMYVQGLSAGGVGARFAGDLMGAGAGAMLGRRFGAAGMAIGGMLGFAGMEASGGGRMFQNAFMNQVATPLLHQRGMTAGIEEMSQGFVNFGGSLNARGAGFTHHAAAEVAAGLRNMAGSTMFQQETGNRFNQQDLFKITQEASRNDLMSGVQSSGQMVGRVREVAKSLSAFMELAQEPDVQRAIQTMGQLRSSGLNLSETMQAVSQGRAFARMAGTSFADISAQAGAMGSAAFQGAGLTAGLGMQTGMMNYAFARGAQNGGTFTPQMLGLVGGAQGLASMNNAFSAGMLQMPMMAPGVMSSAGGVSIGALQSLTGGNINAFQQTTNSAAALQAMTGRQGVEGLGMAIAMQPMIQDTIGRQLQAQGPFAQRNFEDMNIMNTMRQMGMSGSGGFMTMAQAMGMSPAQAMARAQELSSPMHVARQRSQIETQRRDARDTEIAAQEAAAPSAFSTLDRAIDPYFNIRRGVARTGRSIRGALGLDHHSHYRADTDAELRREQALVRSDAFGERIRQNAKIGRAMGDESDVISDYTDDLALSGSRGVNLSLGMGGLALFNVTRMRASRLGAQYGGGPSARESRAREAADVREGARLSGLMASASNQEQTAGTRALQQEFGTQAADRIQAIAARNMVSQLSQGPMGGAVGTATANTINDIGVNAALMMIPGKAGFAASFLPTGGPAFGQRQLTGTAVREAYVTALMQGGGVSRERAEQYFARDPGAAVQAVSAQMQQVMTPEQQAQLRRGAREAAGLGAGRGAAREITAVRAEGARQALFGGHSAEISDAFQEQMGRVRGIGREGSETNTQSRRYVMSMAMLSQRIRAAGGVQTEEGRRLDAQRLSLREEARRRGVDVSDNRLENEITTTANGLEQGTGRELATKFAETQRGKTGASILDVMGMAETELRGERVETRMIGGFAALAGGGGPMAEALRRAGVTTDPSQNVDITAIQQQLARMTPEEMARMSPARRQMIERIRRGGPGAEAAVRQLGYDSGERAQNLREEYQRKHGMAGRFIRRLFGGGEDAYVAENLTRSTEADRLADEQQGQVSALSDLASTLGVGGGGSEMNEAAAQLKQAAQALQSVVQGGGLDRAIAGD
jgi:hypothetical protein